MSKLHSKCQEKHFQEKRTFLSGENFLKVKNYIVNFSEWWAKFFWLWLKAFFFFTTARNFRQGWQLCTPHVEMIFWWNVFFRTNCNFSQRFWTPSEASVDFWRKCLASVVETAFHASRGTCGEKRNYWQEKFWFFVLWVRISFPFLAYVLNGFLELCSTCLHQHLRIKLEVFDLREFCWRLWELLVRVDKLAFCISREPFFV